MGNYIYQPPTTNDQTYRRQILTTSSPQPQSTANTSVLVAVPRQVSLAGWKKHGDYLILTRRVARELQFRITTTCVA